MSRFILLVHLIGVVLWLGGAFASMVVAMAGRRDTPEMLGSVARIQAAITTRLVGPGAALALVSGLVLTMQKYPGAAMAQASPWLFVMQATGVIGALLVLLAALPTAVKLSRIDPLGATESLFHLLRKRQSVVSSVAGMLGIVALVAAVML